METEPSFRTYPNDSSGSGQESNPERSSFIRISRVRNRWVNLLARYFVFIDGEKVGAIRRGETSDFLVSPGQHSVKMLISRIYSSKTATVVTRAGGTATMTCGPSLLGAVPLLGLLVPGRYLSLQLVGADLPA
jgi:hypothetical protein